MNESPIKNNKIFWIDVDSIVPNTYQPRREFDQAALQDLSDSIRQYGVMQPITITEAGKLEDGRNKYELIAGERRLRASKLAGLTRIPAVIRVGDTDRSRFELAIIENLQREDLNPIERATAFQRLVDEFGATHAQIGKQMGKSREYVSNSLRLLSLPKEIMEGLAARKIAEGHTRPLMMLQDKPDEQITLYKEIVYKKLSVRESEKIARKVAQDKVRKEKHKTDPKIATLEQEFSETLGTRVSIEAGGVGGKIVIDYFSPGDLDDILDLIRSRGGSASVAGANKHTLLDRFESTYNVLPKTEVTQKREPSIPVPSPEVLQILEKSKDISPRMVEKVPGIPVAPLPQNITASEESKVLEEVPDVVKEETLPPVPPTYYKVFSHVPVPASSSYSARMDRIEENQKRALQEVSTIIKTPKSNLPTQPTRSSGFHFDTPSPEAQAFTI